MQPTILYANTIDYDFALQQRPHHLMNILAQRNWKVFWVHNKKTNTIREISNQNVILYYNWELFKRKFPHVNVYFSSWSHRHVDLDQINYDICVYDSLDNFQANESQEEKMIDKADVLLTTSQMLYDLRKDHKNIHMCRNACFPEMGNKQYNEPKEFKDLKRPIILFSGALARDWCDLELIEKIAQLYTVAIIGLPWGIKKMPNNINFFGSRTYNELQSYYAHCDINILPFKRCQISDYSNPIKNYEAMSHGKITVAMDIPEATIYPDVVYASKDHSEFLKNIQVALRNKDKQDIINKCKQTAIENSWYNRVDVIEKAILDYNNKFKKW